MNAEEKILDLIFHRLSPERFLNALLNGHDLVKTFKGAFRAAAEVTLAGYSGNEQRLFYKNVCDNAPAEMGADSFPPFYLLTQYGEKTLRNDSGMPLCRFERILSWREVFLQLGQDMVITAWQGKQSIVYGYKQQSFAWPAVILSDNSSLNKMLSEGLAENHYHLYGSAAIFPISWARIMTYPDIILDKRNQWLDVSLQISYSRGSADNLWSTRKRLIYAGYIRCLLFQLLHGLISENELIKSFYRFDCTYLTDSYGVVKLNREVERLRVTYGVKFDQPALQESVCLDYAFTKHLAKDINSDYRIMVGERFFLFQCFAAFFSGRFSSYVQWLFYTYLLLKSVFRAELIQANQQTGFYNFLQYEMRKRELWKMDAYKNESYKTAINAVLNENKGNSLEVRISPEDVKQPNLQKVYQIDLAKLFYDGKHMPSLKRILISEDAWEKEDFFYVFHFIKEEDTLQVKPTDLYTPCRHAKQRKEYRSQAIALSKALNDYDYFCKRVRGIDACANEVTCRPENFACAFRFLRGFSSGYLRKGVLSSLNPRLSASYHVGEDFWDIADGLRAIDEAIMFLQLQRGDRLGHALALGVSPVLHYTTKNRQVILPKQNLLDNYVWLYYRSAELNVSLPPELAQHLYSQAEILFTEIYGRALSNNIPATLSDYYHAWALRGDDPGRYSTGAVNYGFYHGFFDQFAFNNNIPDIAKYRQSERVVELYCCYHFSAQARSVGSQTIQVDISDSYIALMEKMQDAMQQYVDSLGISIECNPSSNVLIGTFKEYQHHPILRFHKPFPGKGDRALQMHVSINTDDQGIFGTSLPFEYSLLAAALANETDENGNRSYSDTDIKQYLEKIREMGQEQTFPAV